MNQRTPANGLPLLVLLTGILFTRNVTSRNKCELTDVKVTPYDISSTFVFKLFYNNTFCTNKGDVDVDMTSCNGTIRYPYWIRAEDEGKTKTCMEEGEWMLTATQSGGSSGHVESNCFKCVGTYMSSTIIKLSSFDFHGLNIEIENIHPRLDNWSLTIYNTTRKEDYFTCNKHTKISKISHKFHETPVQPQHINKTMITVKHEFHPGACYCLVMRPISNLNLRPKNILVTSYDCKPLPPIEEGEEKIHSAGILIFEMLAVLVCILSFVAIMGAVFFYKPSLYRRILGLKLREEKNDLRQRPPLSRKAEVLLINAPDISGNKDLEQLKNELQDTFKVHDFLDCNDHKRLPDPSGWVENMLMPHTGVKMLLVESEGLVSLMNSLLKLYPENPGSTKMTETSPLAQNKENLLMFALRTIICTKLRGDYSTVFVVRLCDKEKDIADLMVQMRRYKFPEHFSELTRDMQKEQPEGEARVCENMTV